MRPGKMAINRGGIVEGLFNFLSNGIYFSKTEPADKNKD